MVSYTTRMPAGIVGTVSRQDSLTITPEFPDASLPPTAYGQAVKWSATQRMTPLASGDAGTLVAGFVARPYPVQSSTNALGAAIPPATDLVNLVRRGFLSIALRLGTAVKGGQLYVVTTAGGSVAVGDYVTSASPAGGGTAVAVPGAVFNGPADANGITEIAYNI